MDLFPLAWPSKHQQRQSLIPSHLQSRSVAPPFAAPVLSSAAVSGSQGIPLLFGRRTSPAVKSFAGRVLGDFGTYLPASNWRAAEKYHQHLEETVLRPLTVEEESRHLEQGPTLAAKEINKDYEPRLPLKPGGKEPLIVPEVVKPSTTSGTLARLAALPHPGEEGVKRLAVFIDEPSRGEEGADERGIKQKKKSKKTVFD